MAEDHLDRMPHAELGQANWTPEERAEFLRRRRARNWLILAALTGFCVIIYGIAIVKLREYGQMW